MPGHLSPREPAPALDADEEQASLRALNRSPHPYHRQSSELLHASELHASELLAAPGAASPSGGSSRPHLQPGQPVPSLLVSSSRESAPGSDSGTDADDEHVLKGLPAPKVRPHKGLRGRNEAVSGTTTPALSPGLGEEELGFPRERSKAVSQRAHKPVGERRLLGAAVRRRRIIVRRTTEVGIIVALAVMIATNRRVRPTLHLWRQDFQRFASMYIALLALYPLRVIRWASWNRRPISGLPLNIASHCDPAPFLYPSAVTLFVSLLVSVNNPAVLLPNLVLAVGAIPQQLVPKIDAYAAYDALHWGLSCLPLIFHSSRSPLPLLTIESLVLIYPLQRVLCAVLHHLTTTSLLTTELQLLSIALVNLALLASSPQAQVLKALIWYGGLSMLVACGGVIQWGIALARVPKWRFRREPYAPKRPFWKSVARFLSWKKIKTDMLGAPPEHDDASERMLSSGEDDEISMAYAPARLPGSSPAADGLLDGDGDHLPSPERGLWSTGVSIRHAASRTDRSPRRTAATHTPSGKKKRTMSVSLRAYFKLTYWQATVRKWVYAAYAYLCLLAIVAVVVRLYIQEHALGGNEPLGWALGYLLGDLQSFRFQVVRANLEHWVCLPERLQARADKQCHMGWVQHVRCANFGEANTRLLIGAYWIAILIVGLAVVFRLKDTYEVDTRRKVFHFMMVGILLPATYVDPAFTALALSVALTVFLILDLLRASQLPPLSKPIASFLAPYVDGRDFRGPVVISHIFLLIGCAVPLWLSLASLPRAGSGYLAGWEVPTREVSMVSGVVCVGLGDAAASLVGRRYGHRKWVWGGGKSLEGSAAFAAAVFLGLTAAGAWLRLGRWPTTGALPSGAVSTTHSLVCASMASLTEAVLTGGNDNVIVPVLLWTCVKALEI
ncbi:Dolichol kinase sec59 [Escovopsis weberi]|uniref:dolichol kinase n=1 Tax=Escovopsis weberi TaxID=150374 RepID=A0A0M8N323_ESCWE|nr:Dolichol kinase sec59 [Escovopsis weberi]